MTALLRHYPGRVALLTAGLSAAGALFGGVAGALALVTGVALTAGPGAVLNGRFAFIVAGCVGALLGVALAPLAGWLLLRRVPLGAAFGGLTAGTIVGGAVGWLLMFPRGDIGLPVGGAAIGFAVAGVLLRQRYRGTTSSPLP